MKFQELVINDPKNLVFGKSPYPVTTPRGLNIGGGFVYPELNFTLPPIMITQDNMPEITAHYKEIVNGALERALHLYSQGVVLEFETLIEMTQYPEIGIELLKHMNEICENYYHQHGLKCEIRLTPNDLREFDRPPYLRNSKYLEPMLKLFEEGAKAGGDLLSIESTGGKEISDDALLMCDIKTLIYSQAVLGVRDVKMLWSHITDIAQRTGKIPGGDTACGFGNTAMVLAERKYIPKVFAAIVRIATIGRSLAAIEAGAKGPDKDCGYEGPFLKAIAGIPISMEGKTSACAHFSPLGNIAAACCDLWSNESVQNIKLLAGMAPTVYMEQLEYDVRLMNQAIKEGENSVLNLQRLFVGSDTFYDPQAIILSPENVIKISAEYVKGSSYIDATKRACLKGIEIIENALNDGLLMNDEKETVWIDVIKNDIQSIPDDESSFTEETIRTIGEGKFRPEEYGL
jgi:methanol---5-hydroxybenzimidazolylcobamide Co-methyltransferase